MKVVLVLALFFSAVYAASLLDAFVDEWEAWKLTFGKRYESDAEERFRMKVYIENTAKINKHNHQALQGKHTYFLKMNHFGDMLNHEFVKQMNGFRNDLRLKKLNSDELSEGATFMAPENVELPEEVDWRKKGAVTPIKDQGQCGSCWAFSATGSLEGQHFRKTGNLTSLSEQNLVDCSEKFDNAGCNGGLMDNAFNYIKANGGIDTEQSYPYVAKEEDSCHYKASTKGAWDVGYTDVESGNEDALKKAVATVGPVSVGIDANGHGFQFYSHGVYYYPYCTNELDHGVLVVGYGVDTSGDKPLKYWTVKNSWAESWGDKGYIKMSRDRDNNCGIATGASYPLV